MGWGIIAVLLLGALLAFIVIQASFASRQWDRVIAAGDVNALGEALDTAFDGWRARRAPRGTPPADWQALLSAELVAADRDRCRVSLLAEPDLRVIDGQREEVGDAPSVARRAAVAMAERLLYEIPHVRFAELQIDVGTEYRAPDGTTREECLLSTRVTRAQAATADWDGGDTAAVLGEWRTRESARGRPLDPDQDALILPDEPGAVVVIRERA
ncbi:MAG: hypothetical protein EXR65_02135 [Dehalococcoidia bacterium]|nr:hypothetical protein [Dehalococcoidia bacterium]